MMKSLNKFLLYVTLLGILIVLIGPLIWMFITSLKTQAEVYAWPPKFIPDRFSLDNFREVLFSRNFGQYFLNTFIVSAGTIFLNLVLGSLAGFAFARLDFPLKRFLFVIVLATMMIPGSVLIVPLLSIIKSVPFTGPAGWINTYQGMIAPNAVTGFSIFLFRQYFIGIPKSLDEQAAIDGCSRFQTYFRIILPLSKPVITLVGIFSFISAWNDYLWPLIVAQDPEMFTLQIGLRFFQTEYGISWNLLMAASIISLLPVLLAYLFGHRAFHSGLGSLGTGIKE